MKITEKIRLWGIVQGVGFRPFVAKCADRYEMKGEVLNIGGLVEVVVTDTKERIDFFVDRLMAEKPTPAEIVHIKREKIEYREFDEFTILRSDDGDDEAAMIPADLSVCPECLKEFYDEENPRYMHPFISCMACGPRYTIVDKFPYDRENTAMIDWPMCDFCEEDYTDRDDRRYHAQTISCHDCGPELIYKENVDSEGNPVEASTAAAIGIIFSSGNPKKEKIEKQVISPIIRAKLLLEAGGVLCMKGVGGYNLVADPLNSEAVAKLRAIKHREQKPFAVMFKNLDTVKKFCYINETEEKLLTSSAKPIILLEHKPIAEIMENIGQNELKKTNSFDRTNNLDEIERSRFIGAFLPSMGAQHLLFDETAGPGFDLLIVTSANLSDMPIIKDEEEIFALMDKEPLIGGCLYNERDIRVRVDDSVVRVIDGQPQMIRRSKGYAPVPLYVDIDSRVPGDSSVEARQSNEGEFKRSLSKEDMILACGGQLKNSFALSKGNFSYVSQYFGDLDSLENRKIYAENVERMAEMFRIEPSLVVCDMHPLYATTEFAEKYAAANDGKIKNVLRVQHHHAHIASVMAEHNLIGKVIGVSMDGTGYGTDGAIWGGEFMLCQGAEFSREAHLKYVDMIGGDSSMKDAAKSAVCYKWAYEHGYAEVDECRDGHSGNSKEVILDLSEIMEYASQNGYPVCKESPLIEGALRAGINVIKSSSMGRLFDAVSALLGIKDYNDYEGQCAIMLEDAAYAASKNPGASERNDLALSFHERVAAMIADTCHRIRAGEYNYSSGGEDAELDTSLTGEGINKVCLTGGVFQNKILTERTLELLREDGFEVYYNVSVSPNDGGIALGQNYIGLCRLQNI